MAYTTERCRLVAAVVLALSCGPRLADGNADSGSVGAAGTTTDESTTGSSDSFASSGDGSESSTGTEYPDCPDAKEPLPALFRYRKGMTGEAHESEGYREPCEVTSLEDGDGFIAVHLGCFMWDQVFTPAYEIPHSEHALRIPRVGDMVTVSTSTLGDDVGEILLHKGSTFFPEIRGMSFEWVTGVCPYEEVLLSGRSPEVVVAERIALDVTHETGTVRLFAGESATFMQPSLGDRFLVGVQVAYCIEDPEGPDADSDCPRRRQAYHIGRLE